MKITLLDELALGFSPKLPLILQTEASECALASLGMIAGFHGHRVNLPALRQRFAVSLKGTTLDSLIRMASSLNLSSRPVKLDLDRLDQLTLPCILHWNFNHFVVLQRVGSTGITIHDPAVGIRSLTWEAVSNSFTGVALELWPNADFTPQAQEPSLPLRRLLGRITGLTSSISLILTLALTLEVFAIVNPFYLQWVIDNGVPSADRNLLATLAIGFAIVMLIQKATWALRSWTILHLSTTLNVQWRANILTHLLHLPIQYFERRHIGDVISRFGAVDQIQHTLTTSFLEAALDGVMTLATLVIMYLVSPQLTAVAVTCIALYGIARIAWYRPLVLASEENIVHSAKQQTHLLETIRGIKAIRLFQREERRRTDWITLFVDQTNSGIRIQKLALLYQLLNGLLFGAATLLIVWIGANEALDGQLTVGLLTAFVAYKSQFDDRVGGLIDKLFQLRMLRLQGGRLADIVLTPPDTDKQEALTDTGQPIDPSIEVSGVRLRYAEHEPYVLDGISFRVEAGESVALIGPSGCGKTTLVNVLLGVLQPTEGDVRIGGRSIRQAGYASVRRAIGTVLQDDMLFAGSIEDNITFFDSSPDRDWMFECARLSAIDDEIREMPMAYSTLIGDMGTVLSGGQKQRILLARALYRRPALLFLDEATSHLDIRKEQEVNAAIRSLNLTRIIVAHRPETISSANRVIELSRGRLVEQRRCNPDIHAVTT